MGIISFVILHYGDIRTTKECTDSIMRLDTTGEVHIVLVDNDSNKTEEERELLQGQYKDNQKVEIIKIQENTGFSRANNIGYAYTMQQHNPDYVIIANNDIVFEQKDFLNKMKDVYETYAYAVLSPDVVRREDGMHQSPIDIKARTVKQVNYTIYMNAVCLKLFPVIYPLLWWNDCRQRKRKQQQVKKKMCQNIVPCGACIILSRQFTKKEDKVFAPETKFYYEEYILQYQCIKKGYNILYYPELQVIHGDGISTKKKAGDERSRMRFVMEQTLCSAKIYKKLIQGELDD